MSLTAITDLLAKLPDVLRGAGVPVPFSSDPKHEVDPLKAVATAISKTSVKNLNRQAANSIAFYPMVASNSLSLDTIKVTAKHLERKLADLIRIILTSDDIIDLSKNMTKKEVINMFKGATIGTGNNKDFASSRNRRGGAGVRTESFPMNLGQLLEYVDEHNIRDIDAVNCTVRNEAGAICKVMSQSITSALNESVLNESSDKTLAKALKDFEKDGTGVNAKSLAAAASKHAKSNDHSIGADVGKGDKANDMSPLILEVKVIYRTEAGLENTTIVMAVKVVTHLVPSDKMIREVGASMQQDRFMFKAIQWATGEIKFWRDLVLNIKDMKKAASGDRFSHLFQSLKMNASGGTAAAALGGDAMLPTTTMVMTMDEVEEIDREFGVDLQSPSQADKFFNLFGLVGFIIIDESTNSMYVYDEITHKFDTLSVAQEKSDNKGQNDLMKVLAATMSSR